MSEQNVENCNKLSNLMTMLPENDRSGISTIIGGIMDSADQWGDCFENPETGKNDLIVDRNNGSFSITFSNGKKLVYEPKIVDV